AARDVPARGRVDRVDPAAANRERGQEEQRIDPQQADGRLGVFLMEPLDGCAVRSGVHQRLTLSSRPQRVRLDPFTILFSWFLMPKSAARIRRASGAAVWAPKPPCSSVTATT